MIQTSRQTTVTGKQRHCEDEDTIEKTEAIWLHILHRLSDRSKLNIFSIKQEIIVLSSRLPVTSRSPSSFCRPYCTRTVGFHSCATGGLKSLQPFTSKTGVDARH